MGNSVFLDNTVEWLENLGLPDISEFEAMLILTAACLVLLVIFWLAFRKTRLWYWKTDIQIDTLKSIDVRLHSVEDRLSQGFSETAKEMDCDPSDNEEGQLPETVRVKAATEADGLSAIGKSGRIYTEAELELQIRE